MPATVTAGKSGATLLQVSAFSSVEGHRNNTILYAVSGYPDFKFKHVTFQ
jgi:hypothetical protein